VIDMTARAMTRPARFFLGAGSTAIALALGGVPLMLTASANAAPSDLTICHATGSFSGPYVTHHPSKTADAGGHDGHEGGLFDGVTPGWGDIIPPFDYPATNKTPAGHYPGKNWTAVGQDFYNNGGCDGDGVVGGGTTGGTTTGTTGETSGTTSTTGETSGTTSTTGETSGTTSTTGETSGTTSTTGETSGTTSTTGETSGTTSTTGETSGTTGETSGTTGETSGTTSGTTGGDGGATTGFTGGGGGGTVNVPPTKPTKPVSQGGGTVAKGELPFTGSNTQNLALWGLASLIGGLGFCSLGKRNATR
jgi:LPXTG-motif cell wall-anchored protein